MGIFDGIDLGNDKTMQRMMRKAKDERHTIMLEMADFISQAGHTEAAKLIQDKIIAEQVETKA